MSSMRDRSRFGLLILAAAIPRLFLAWITLGTADMTACFRNFTWMLSGLQPQLPYLPGAELMIYLGGVAAYHTALPAGFAFKLLPVLFDVATAFTLRARAPRAAWLYAFAPLPLIVNSMHGQWEGMVLYFLVLALVLASDDRAVTQALAGAAFVLSVIVKPIALPLALLFLLTPGEKQRAVQRALRFGGGAVTTGLLYLLIAGLAGYPLDADRLTLIFDYVRFGGHYFGLPSGHLPVVGRFLTIIPALVITGLYWKQRLSREDAALLVFCFAIGGSPLAPQYLCWIPPLALLAGRYRFCAAYSLVAGLFLTFFYSESSFIAGPLFMGAYGILRPLAWLTPQAPPLWISPMLFVLGDYVLPLLCLGYGLLRVVRAWSRENVQQEPSPARGVLLPAALLLVLVTSVVVWASSRPEVKATAFVDRIHAKVAKYDVVGVTGPGREVKWVPRRLLPNRVMQEGRGFDAASLSTMLAVWVLLWSMAAGTLRQGITDRHP